MMRWKTVGLVAVGATVLACSGRYEVGGMDQAGGTSSVTNGLAAGGAASAGRATMVAMSLGDQSSGGSVSLSMGDPGPSASCVSTGAPSPLNGPFAAPGRVWERLSMLIFGKQVPAPVSLPKTASYSWAGQLVTDVFNDLRSTSGSSPGAAAFVAQWLGLDPLSGKPATFMMAWDKRLLEPTLPALPTLLGARLGDDGRIGVFTEPAWLALHTNISQRGAGIAAVLFQSPIPPPPPNFPNSTPDPKLPDRQALEQSLSQPPCQACHQLMDPRGYELGNFDAMGQYRELDHGEPVDTTGSIQLDGASVSYDTLADFMTKSASSCDANLAFADGFMRAALVLNQVPDGSREELFMANQERFRQAFMNSARSYVDLVRAYAQSPLGLGP